MPTIHAVLFDFGKVLSLDPNPAVWVRLQALTNLSEPDLSERYWRDRDGYDEGLLNSDQYWRGIAGADIPQQTLQLLKAADVDLWTDMNAPLLEWVEALHAAGVRTGILSNMPDAMAEGICRRFPWIDSFHHTIWSHALKLRKPQPEIYAAAIRGLDVAPEHILFLDDKAENVAAAQRAGMQTLLYRDHPSFVQEMNSRNLGALLSPSQGGNTAPY